MNRVVDISVGKNRSAINQDHALLKDLKWTDLIDGIKDDVIRSGAELSEEVKDCITGVCFKLRDLVNDSNVLDLLKSAKDDLEPLQEWLLQEFNKEYSNLSENRYLEKYEQVTELPTIVGDKSAEIIEYELRKAKSFSLEQRFEGVQETMLKLFEVLAGNIKPNSEKSFNYKVFFESGTNVNEIDNYFFRNTEGKVIPLRYWLGSEPMIIMKRSKEKGFALEEKHDPAEGNELEIKVEGQVEGAGLESGEYRHINSEDASVIYEFLMGVLSGFYQECDEETSRYFIDEKKYQNPKLLAYPLNERCKDLNEAVLLFCKKRLAIESKLKEDRKSDEKYIKDTAAEFYIDKVYSSGETPTRFYNEFISKLEKCIDKKFKSEYGDDLGYKDFFMSYSDMKLGQLALLSKGVRK